MIVAIIMFFSFGIAPIIFKVLPIDHAGRFVRALFPRYYMWLTTLAVIALPGVAAPPLAAPELRGPGVAVRCLALVGVILTLLYCSESLTPAINQARDQGEAGKPLFNRLHRRSVRLNAIVLGTVAVLLAAALIGPKGRISGIIEQPPRERARADYDRFAKSLEEYRKKDAERKRGETERAKSAPGPQ